MMLVKKVNVSIPPVHVMHTISHMCMSYVVINILFAFLSYQKTKAGEPEV